MRGSSQFIGLLILAGCSTSHGADGDVDAGVVDHCGPWEEGTPCTFTEPCRAYSDFWMGRCGEEEWRCEDGRVVYEDHTFECEPPPPDAGVGGPWCAEYVLPPADTEQDCRSDADCGGGATCWAPGDTSPFHVSGACPMECASDADCGEGVCQPFNAGSCRRCTPRCTPESCNLWEACGDDGHCGPRSCEDGYACPPGASCDPGADGADAHGCLSPSCTSDAECGCGACVLGRCASGPGRCVLPRA